MAQTLLKRSTGFPAWLASVSRSSAASAHTDWKHCIWPVGRVEGFHEAVQDYFWLVTKILLINLAREMKLDFVTDEHNAVCKNISKDILWTCTSFLPIAFFKVKNNHHFERMKLKVGKLNTPDSSITKFNSVSRFTGSTSITGSTSTWAPEQCTDCTPSPQVWLHFLFSFWLATPKGPQVRIHLLSIPLIICYLFEFIFHITHSSYPIYSATHVVPRIP